MVKDLLKAGIIGASIIVSTIIYSERNKYEIHTLDGGEGKYPFVTILNKRSGVARQYKGNTVGFFIYEYSFEKNDVIGITDGKLIIE